VTASSESRAGQPRSELRVPWSLAMAACGLAAILTPNAARFSSAVGIPLLVGGSALMLISMSMVGDRHTLVVDGPYRWVRHPAYVGLLTMLAGLVIFTWSFWGALAFAPAAVLTYARARREEHNLHLRFGARYEAYRQQVPFAWPRITLSHGGGQGEPDVRRK